MKPKEIILKPKSHLIFLILLLIVCFCFWRPQQMDDGISFQRFAEVLVQQGRVDFSIPGFHGTDFLVALVYLITGSQFAVYLVDMLAALFLVPLIYLVVKEIYKKEWWGVIASYLYVLMPFEVFNALRGGHQTLHFVLSFWALYLLFKNKKYNWLVLGLAHITRPFSVLLLPFYIYKKRIKDFILSLILPVGYIVWQYSQIGKIMMGQHPGLTVEQFFSIKRFFVNVVYGLQNYFSIHNFSPVNNLYLMDMVHLSPLIFVAAVVGIFYAKKYFIERRMFWTLCSFAAISFLLPCLFYHLDMWYLGIFNLALIFLALPVLDQGRKLWPVIIFTFSYQFFYFFLSYGKLFVWPLIVFIIPLVIFIVSLVFYVQELKKEKRLTENV